MKVFISWSGKRSQYIADALRWWLPHVIQSVEPFMSSQDIRKGARGNVKLAENLESAAVGIICLTPENLTAPWVLFEAGALSKLQSAYVCTLLYELDPSDVEPPVGQFQHSRLNKIELRALLETINSELDAGLGQKRLDESFENWYPKLEEKLAGIPKKPKSEPTPKERTDDSKLDELLELVRRTMTSKTSFEDLLSGSSTASSTSSGKISMPSLEQVAFRMQSCVNDIKEGESAGRWVQHLSDGELSFLLKRRIVAVINGKKGGVQFQWGKNANQLAEAIANLH